MVGLVLPIVSHPLGFSVLGALFGELSIVARVIGLLQLHEPGLSAPGLEHNHVLCTKYALFKGVIDRTR